MKNLADVISALTSLGWLALAAFIAIAFRSIMNTRRGDLTKLSVGPTGFTAEFVSNKLDEASKDGAGPTPGPRDKGVLAERLHSHRDLVQGAHLLWVDDHPENNEAMVELLSRFGVKIEIALNNAEAYSTLTRHPQRFQVLISDMGRDDEPAAGDFPGAAFATRALELTGIRTILFTGRFRPTSVPGLNADEAVLLADSIDRATFGNTNRPDELVHLIIDLLERSPRWSS